MKGKSKKDVVEETVVGQLDAELDPVELRRITIDATSPNITEEDLKRILRPGDEIVIDSLRSQAVNQARRAKRSSEDQARWRASGGEARKGSKSPFRHAVEQLAQRLQTRDVERILDEMFRDTLDASDLLDDLRASPDDPVLVRFQGVPDADECSDEAKILFLNIPTGKEESRACKTLKNYLANINPEMLPMSG